MKKMIFAAIAIATMTMTACTNTATTAPTTESTVVDSTAVSVDSTAKTVDTAATKQFKNFTIRGLRPCKGAANQKLDPIVRWRNGRCNVKRCNLH